MNSGNQVSKFNKTEIQELSKEMSQYAAHFSSNGETEFAKKLEQQNKDMNNYFMVLTALRKSVADRTDIELKLVNNLLEQSETRAKSRSKKQDELVKAYEAELEESLEKNKYACYLCSVKQTNDLVSNYKNLVKWLDENSRSNHLAQINAYENVAGSIAVLTRKFEELDALYRQEAEAEEANDVANLVDVKKKIKEKRKDISVQDVCLVTFKKDEQAFTTHVVNQEAELKKAVAERHNQDVEKNTKAEDDEDALHDVIKDLVSATDEIDAKIDELNKQTSTDTKQEAAAQETVVAVQETANKNKSFWQRNRKKILAGVAVGFVVTAAAVVGAFTFGIGAVVISAVGIGGMVGAGAGAAVVGAGVGGAVAAGASKAKENYDNAKPQKEAKEKEKGMNAYFEKNGMTGLVTPSVQQSSQPIDMPTKKDKKEVTLSSPVTLFGGKPSLEVSSLTPPVDNSPTRTRAYN